LPIAWLRAPRAGDDNAAKAGANTRLFRWRGLPLPGCEVELAKFGQFVPGGIFMNALEIIRLIGRREVPVRRMEACVSVDRWKVLEFCHHHRRDIVRIDGADGIIELVSG